MQTTFQEAVALGAEGLTERSVAHSFRVRAFFQALDCHNSVSCLPRIAQFVLVHRAEGAFCTATKHCTWCTVGILRHLHGLDTSAPYADLSVERRLHPGHRQIAQIPDSALTLIIWRYLLLLLGGPPDSMELPSFDRSLLDLIAGWTAPCALCDTLYIKDNQV